MGARDGTSTLSICVVFFSCLGYRLRLTPAALSRMSRFLHRWPRLYDIYSSWNSYRRLSTRDHLFECVTPLSSAANSISARMCCPVSQSPDQHKTANQHFIRQMSTPAPEFSFITNAFLSNSKQTLHATDHLRIDAMSAAHVHSFIHSYPYPYSYPYHVMQVLDFLAPCSLP